MIKRISARDIIKARELVSLYGGANLSSMSRASKEDLVSLYYSTINRIPLADVPDDQLHRVAERLYHKACRITERARNGTLESFS